MSFPSLSRFLASTEGTRSLGIHSARGLALGAFFALAAAMLPGATSPAAADIPPDLTLESVTFLSQTLGVRHAGDGSDRIFLFTKNGTIRIFDLATETLLPTPFLDITGDVDDSENEEGLLGLAFHPDYATNGRFFVNYIWDPGAGPDRTRIEEYQVSADPNVADPATARTVLEITQDASNHNGGDIHFGPDGYLYIGMGDGGGSGDPNDRAQSPLFLLGKMLRIDIDGPVSTNLEVCGNVVGYAIPVDNPFAAQDGTCDEIWAFGLRNPYRWSFDRETGDQFIGDVGQDAWEEWNVQTADTPGGVNWGWDCREGANNFELDGCGDLSQYTDPIFETPHTGTSACSAIGGYRYRGPIGPMQGEYIHTDFCIGDLYFGNDTTGSWTRQTWAGDSLSFPNGFGEDEAGNLYATENGGTVYRFTSSFLFTEDFESGDTGGFEPSTKARTVEP